MRARAIFGSLNILQLKRGSTTKDLFIGIFRLIFQEEILLEQEDVPIGCGEQSLVTGTYRTSILPFP